ncbi:MAG: helix-turn-helix domain-containing protein [Anaerolineales bacterium]
MSSQNSNNEQVVQEGKLLSAQERVAFRMISTGNDLHGQRAIALLAIDEGASQEEAAQRAGLTAGQVKYWLGKFRRVRMEIFPEQVLLTDQFDPHQETADTGAQAADKPKKAKKSQGKKSKKKSGKKSKTKKGKKSKNEKGKGKNKKKGKDKKKEQEER